MEKKQNKTWLDLELNIKSEENSPISPGYAGALHAKQVQTDWSCAGVTWEEPGGGRDLFSSGVLFCQHFI